jgi:hypothetical protein
VQGTKVARMATFRLGLTLQYMVETARDLTDYAGVQRRIDAVLSIIPHAGVDRCSPKPMARMGHALVGWVAGSAPVGNATRRCAHLRCGTKRVLR